jgi:thiol-disulfide isomerase/thioredoxin
MKSFALFFASLLVIYGFYLLYKPSNNSVDSIKGKYDNLTIPLPKLDVTTISGRKINLGDFAGKEMIINFMASWCLPCIYEFPIILDNVFKHNGNKILIVVSIDHKLRKLENFRDKFLEKYKLEKFPEYIYIINDPEQKISYRQFGTKYLPETFLVNSERIIYKKIVGNLTYADLN